jgi:hypothetical protein
MNPEMPTGLPGSYYECALTDCDFKHHVTPVEIPDDIYGGPNVARAFAEQSTAIETALREHFQTHDVEDWLREIMSLRTQLNQAHVDSLPSLSSLSCAGCTQDARNMESAGNTPLPIHPAATIINGVAICDVEGRHRIVTQLQHHVAQASALIGPDGQPLPRLNGHGG